ncbi:hypothetical protein EVAR_42559_1 [Eumeta japonica]|uniref:Uncharacterized protein n=1 Tax=Eumeta variegata TaxID=151549 RepID=A0A4C1WUE8_EUMVA|nr:hypothetical protein EVAR_42559_1 [Eumeta japonica]
MATVAIENCRTVNSDWYTTISSPEVIDQLRKNNPERCIIVHQYDELQPPLPRSPMSAPAPAWADPPPPGTEPPPPPPPPRISMPPPPPPTINVSRNLQFEP